MNETIRSLGTRSALTILAGIAFAAAVLFLVVNYSAVAKEYTCEGYTQVNNGDRQKDHGRLQIEHYRFWVALWNAKSDGSALFQSTKLAIYEGELIESGEGNFTVHTGISSDQFFSFARATNQISIGNREKVFRGHCIAAI